MYASQKPIAAKSYASTVVDAAWKTKASYGIVATEDKTISPDLERMMYKRSGTSIIEIKSSHAVFLSHPNEVAKVIIGASEKK
jgi:hypothetical protein